MLINIEKHLTEVESTFFYNSITGIQYRTIPLKKQNQTVWLPGKRLLENIKRHNKCLYLSYIVINDTDVWANPIPYDLILINTINTNRLLVLYSFILDNAETMTGGLIRTFWAI